MKMRMTDSFEIRPYTKKELALLYFPLVSDPHVAVNRLMSWIARCRPLLTALQGGGYRKTAKWFTSRNVRLTAPHLGELPESPGCQITCGIVWFRNVRNRMIAACTCRTFVV